VQNLGGLSTASNEHSRRSEEKTNELLRELQTQMGIIRELQPLPNDMSNQMGIIRELQSLLKDIMSNQMGIIRELQPLLNDMSNQMGIIREQGKENSARFDSISEQCKENLEQGKKDRTRFENWIKVVYIQGQKRVKGIAGILQETQEKFIQTQTGVAKLQEMLRDIFMIEETPQNS
jgi:hypothetical protein